MVRCGRGRPDAPYFFMSIVKRRQKLSAGVLAYRRNARGELEFFLAHPGGPFWAKKDEGVWTIPKGEPDPGEEDLLAVARREFAEETGVTPPAEGYDSLGTITQKSGKVVHAWGCEFDLDEAAICSNRITVEWPPKSGRMVEIPEVDRCGWFGMEEARRRINPAQVELLERLSRLIREDG